MFASLPSHRLSHWLLLSTYPNLSYSHPFNSVFSSQPSTSEILVPIKSLATTICFEHMYNLKRRLVPGTQAQAKAERQLKARRAAFPSASIFPSFSPDRESPCRVQPFLATGSVSVCSMARVH
ncbi:hypothetical protein BDV18DRAFT_143979 [Aspergillus unguis]